MRYAHRKTPKPISRNFSWRISKPPSGIADRELDVAHGRAAQRPVGLRPVVPAVVVYLARIAGVADHRLDLRRQARSRTRIVDAVGNAGAQCPAATDPTFSHSGQLAREAAKRCRD